MDRKTDKKIVQDIVVTGRRSIRDVAPTEGELRARRKEKILNEIKDEYEEEKPVRVPMRVGNRKITKEYDRESDKKYEEQPETRRSSRPERRANKEGRRFSGTVITFVIVFIGIAVMAVALSLLYSRAVVTITPRTTQFAIDSTYTAKKSTVAASTDLPYEVITASLSDHQAIPAADGPLIQTKAKGTAYLYNEQAIQQKILAGTRLSNSKGLIYRTSTTVVIPPGKTAAGKATPGSISISIVADQAGSNYNMALSDLTGDLSVVAYKGGDKYTKVYGRIKTDITGGFSGNKKIISPDLQNAAIQSIETSLKAKLNAKLKDLVQTGYTFYGSATTYEFQTPDPSSKATSTVDVMVNGTAYGVIFKSDSLLKFIAQKDIQKFAAPAYTTKGLDALTLVPINVKDFSAKKGTPFIFTLKGPITLVGTFSETVLKNELKGISITESNAIFAKYPSIANAYALITPFWMRSFPNSPEKIILEIKSE